MGTKRQFNNLKVGLTVSDRTRLNELAKDQKRTNSEIARDAVRWYLNNQDKISQNEREAEVAKAIRYATDQIVRAIANGVDRMCKMLARQGIAIGTLYEITWMSLPDETAKKAFEQAITQAKQKMRKHAERDEQAIAAAMEKNLGVP